WQDELVKGTLVTRDGQVVHPMLAGKKPALEDAPAAAKKPAKKAKEKGK
ncbi:MAG: NAD(P)(+) transhydrogenase (Re/Si-specific) subunit alpha, partial [Rhodospirillales bacterium]|nr:NAD(P)(+) transhydrogenase (Re/Si-specific) subunit alpha [Rhodospirillales bacterium]